MIIDPRILADTLEICTTGNAQIRLMNDIRWPWLILLPVQADIQELHDLTSEQRKLFMTEVNRASRVMKEITGCLSVNIAMLGNVVPQLHCHVVARHEGDPNWPGPVWGHEAPRAYTGQAPVALMDAVRSAFTRE